MNVVGGFLDEVIPLLRDEIVALQNGDPGPRKALWSHATLSLSLGPRRLLAVGSRSNRSLTASPRVSRMASPVPTRCWGPVSVATSGMRRPSSDPLHARGGRT
jgi:hypothetical protein